MMRTLVLKNVPTRRQLKQLYRGTPPPNRVWAWELIFVNHFGRVRIKRDGAIRRVRMYHVRSQLRVFFSPKLCQ